MEKYSNQQENEHPQKLARAQQELAIMYEVSNAMRTTLELEHILHIILTGVTSHTGLGFNRAILFLVNPKERCLEPRMAIGPESGAHAEKIWSFIKKSNQHLDDLIDEEKVVHSRTDSPLYESIKRLKISLGDQGSSLLAKVFTEGNSLHITPDKIHEYQKDPLLEKFHTNELIVMPLRAKNNVNGLIVADNLFTQKPISNEDLKMLAMLANQAGLAIENSQLYEKIRHKSHTDAVTELWNHGFFQHQLELELKTHIKEKIPLTLLVLDIDDFKMLNDTHGHQTGDLVLKELAMIFKESSREIDFACRYGGEEFSIILTQTNQKQACSIAERIRQNIEEHLFTEKNLSVTASIGVATLPDDVKTKEELIALADKAMYQAKFGGKNQISIA